MLTALEIDLEKEVIRKRSANGIGIWADQPSAINKPMATLQLLRLFLVRQHG